MERSLVRPTVRRRKTGGPSHFCFYDTFSQFSEGRDLKKYNPMVNLIGEKVR
jgi:hypothetical protein